MNKKLKKLRQPWHT